MFKETSENFPEIIENWRERLKQLPQLYKASKGDIIAIEQFISEELSKARDDGFDSAKTWGEYGEKSLEETIKLSKQEAKREVRGKLENYITYEPLSTKAEVIEYLLTLLK